MKNKFFFDSVNPDSEKSLDVTIVRSLMTVRRSFRKLGYYMKVAEFSKQIRDYVKFLRQN